LAAALESGAVASTISVIGHSPLLNLFLLTWKLGIKMKIDLGV